MIKPATSFMLCSFLVLFPFDKLSAAEYDLTGSNCYHGEYNVIVRGKGDFSLSYVLHGASTYDDESVPFRHMATRCVGLYALRNGEIESYAHCEMIDGDGDKLFVLGNARGQQNSGTFPGGTGKFEGVTGTFTSEPVGRFPEPEERNFVACRRHHHTFTLPD